MKENIKSIIIYCTDWCSSCIQLEGFLKLHGVGYEIIDIEEDQEGAKIVREINNGDETVPTVIIKFKDETRTSLTDPSWGEIGKIILNTTS